MEEKLEALRERWRKEPKNRKVIEMQARLLKMAKDSGKEVKDKVDDIFGDLIKK